MKLRLAPALLSTLVLGCGGAQTQNQPPVGQQPASTQSPSPPPAPEPPDAATSNHQSALDLPCAKRARDVEGDEDTSRLVRCPAGCAETAGTVWGTDFYTDDSAVCAAMIHAGALTSAGGVAQITFVVGLRAYVGSERNGIRSQSYHRWKRSFYAQSLGTDGEPTTPAPALPDDGRVRIGCDHGSGIVGSTGESLTVICPAGCGSAAFRLWGSNPYTSDSSICPAAIHAGVIPEAGGGREGHRRRGSNQLRGQYEERDYVEQVRKVRIELYGSGAVTSFDARACAGCIRSCNVRCETFQQVGGVMIPNRTTMVMRCLIQASMLVAIPLLVSACCKENTDTQPCPGSYSALTAEQKAGEATCSCANSSAAGGSVWGSDIYTSDSSICRAGVHAGVIPATGGNVTVKGAPGCGAYTGTTRNGVVSGKWESFGSSFYFPGKGDGKCAAAPAVAAGDPCPTLFKSIPGLSASTTITCRCDAGLSSAGPVWGSSIYTQDSAICRAAVHAGAIPASGGTVTAKAAGGCKTYIAKLQNGVQSSKWGEYDASFYFPSHGTGACLE